MRGPLLALVALALLPLELPGQWVSPRRWERVSVGLGAASARSAFEPTGRNGIAAMAAFEVVALRHLELRLSGTLFEGLDAAESQLGGVAADVVVFPWRGRVEPYAGLGAGVYLVAVDDGSPTATTRRQDHKGPAWTGLAGARVRVGRVKPFVEWRYTRFSDDAPMRRYSPLLLGLHL